MYCPNCKKALEEGAVFCPDCGTKALPNRRCPLCGQTLEEDMLYCPECGSFVGAQADGASAPSPAPNAPQQTPSPSPGGWTPYEPPSPPAAQKSASPVPWLAAAGICLGVIALVICFFVIRKKDDSSPAPYDTKEQQLADATEDTDQETLPTETPTELPTEMPTETPTPTPEVTEAPKTLEGMRTKEEQQSVLNPGAQLDLQHMNNLLANTNATYSCYLLDITNMQEYDVASADYPMPASALIGVPILFTVADGVDNGSLDLGTPVLFTYTFDNGRGSLKSGDNGKTFPLSELLTEALLYSDNNALNSLMDHLSLDRINTTCHSYGFTSVDLQRKLTTASTSLENYISARDAAMMLQAIYQNNFQGIGREFLQANFKISVLDTANTGMYPASGRCQTFLNLNGITDTRYNEIGLFQNGDETFILSIFTCNGVGISSAGQLTTITTYVLDTLQAH